VPQRMTEQERQGFLTESRVAVLSVASDGERPPLTLPV
jgi:nitroimidazol reductase NimA-like FMN-containing flavoprotein (pyridoxamine 5'-phosphate oxidase superfamily)